MVNMGNPVIFIFITVIASFSLTRDTLAVSPTTVPVLTCISCSTDLKIFKEAGIDPCSDKYIRDYSAREEEDARLFGIQNITCLPNQLCFKDKSAIYTYENGKKFWNENHTTFRRGCGELPEKKSYPNHCYGDIGVQGRVDNCFCDTDVCNDAFSHQTHKSLTSLITMLFCVIFIQLT
ncbi:uncharacterized protein LOC141898691 [Tubulanus polymorphus]|uniref:uncharacterized protein LOC141898691 n=1 Tax=Tubulanus polymorphus TaxID=672921 RepID=UPI003DA5D911